MKIFKLIGVVAVIGIGLWGSTVHAQHFPSRTVDLECVFGNAVTSLCVRAVQNGQLVIQRFETGPAVGLVRSFITLHVSLPCRDANPNRGGVDGPRQFFGLYITVLGITERIISFNPNCFSFKDTIFARLPVNAVDIDEWFTEDLLVEVILEDDDALNSSGAPLVVLTGTD